MSIVVLAPRGTRETVSTDLEVTLIGWEGSPVDIEVPPPGAMVQRLNRLLGGGFLMRIPLRLLGADTATQFARRVFSNATARAALASADLVLAVDEDAVLAAWRAQRSSTRDVTAVYGWAAARAVLAARERER